MGGSRTKNLDIRARELLEELVELSKLSANRDNVSWAQRHAIASALHRAIQADRRRRARR